MNAKKATILLAGDDYEDLTKLAVSLQMEKFKVLSINNRDAIVNLARSEVPSLILLDLKSCFDICRMLKRNFVTEPIPVIALLFPAEEVDRVAVLELGADDCVAKPFSLRELLLRIRCSLKRALDKKNETRHKQTQHYSTLTRRFSVSTLANG